MTIATCPPVSPTIRRHIDPPFLWLSMLAGSLLLNGALILGGQQYLQRARVQSVKFAPVAVKFLPVKTATAKRVTPTAIAPSTKAPATITSVVPDPVAPSAPTSAPRIALESEAIARPKRKPAKTKPSITKSLVRPNPTPLTPLAPSQTTSPHSSTQPSNNSTQSTDDVATSAVGLPRVPAVPDPNATNQTTPAPLGAVTVASNATPAKFLMQMRVLPSSRDRTLSPANLEQAQLTKTLTSGDAGCSLTPETLRNFNRPVDLNLTLDDKGTVINAVSTNPPNSDQTKSYQDLVICTLKTVTLNSTSLPSFVPPVEPNKLAIRATLTKE